MGWERSDGGSEGGRMIERRLWLLRTRGGFPHSRDHRRPFTPNPRPAIMSTHTHRWRWSDAQTRRRREEFGALLAISVRGHAGFWDWIIDKAELAALGTWTHIHPLATSAWQTYLHDKRLLDLLSREQFKRLISLYLLLWQSSLPEKQTCLSNRSRQETNATEKQDCTYSSVILEYKNTSS